MSWLIYQLICLCFAKNITESVGFGETCCLAVRLPFFFWFHHSIVHPVAYNTISILISLGTFVTYAPPPSPQLACRFLYTSFFLQRCNWAKICTPQKDGTAMSSMDYNQFSRWASYQNPNHGKTDALSHVTREYFLLTRSMATTTGSSPCHHSSECLPQPLSYCHFQYHIMILTLENIILVVIVEFSKLFFMCISCCICIICIAV